MTRNSSTCEYAGTVLPSAGEETRCWGETEFRGFGWEG